MYQPKKFAYDVLGLYGMNNGFKPVQDSFLADPNSFPPYIIVLVRGSIYTFSEMSAYLAKAWQRQYPSVWDIMNDSWGIEPGVLIAATGNEYFWIKGLDTHFIRSNHSIPLYLLPGIKEAIAEWANKVYE